jgi:PAS domain S-box-containing protein
MSDDRSPLESEDIVRAIRAGEVDAFVITQAQEERIYSLRSADLLYRAMIEDMKDGAVALDPSGLIVYCNAYFAQLVKADRASLVGAKIFSFVPSDGDEFFDSMRAQVENGTRRRELELRAADGTTLPVLAVMNRIRVDDGGDVYCLVVTDLTDQKHRDQLVVEGQRKDDFLAMLAHELRNPIAPIRYAAERLGLAAVTPDRLQWARNVIARQTEQLTRLVDDLLDASRIARGKVTLNLEELDADTAVSRAVDAIRPIIESRHQELKITRSGGRLRIRGDAARLTQVISNLLQNAAKFTPEGGRISIDVGLEPAGDGASSVRIAVTDNGIGIAPEYHERIFGVFKRLHGKRISGTGIGLAIVKKAMERLGGAVGVHSDGVNGTSFWIELKAA